MADKAELLAEAYRRGLLPPDKRAAYEEAQRRGLIGGGQKPSLAGDFAGGVRQAFGKLADDTRDDFRRVTTRRAPANPVEFLRESGEDLGRTVRGVGNLFAAVTSPLTAAVDATVTKPAARALNAMPVRPHRQDNPFSAPRALEGEEAQAFLEGQIGTALMGARAGPLKAGPPRPPAAKPAPRMRASDLPAAKQAAYKSVENAGVTYRPEAIDDLIRGVTDEAQAASISPLRHPKASSMLQEIQGLRGKSPTLTELDQLRQVIRRDVASANDPAEAFFGRKMIQGLDEFISAAGPDQVTAGDAVRGAATIKQARDLNTRVRKVEAVEDAVESARLRAGSTGSGGNVDNATRQNLRRVLENERNFTPDERAALEEIVVGGQGQNLLRLVGKLSPGGNGLMTALNIGGAAANPLLAIPGVAGIVSKMTADAMTARKVQRLIDMIAAGGAKVTAPPRAAPSAQTVAGGAALTNLFARELSEPGPRRPAPAAR